MLYKSMCCVGLFKLTVINLNCIVNWLKLVAIKRNRANVIKYRGGLYAQAPGW